MFVALTFASSQSEQICQTQLCLTSPVASSRIVLTLLRSEGVQTHTGGHESRWDGSVGEWVGGLMGGWVGRNMKLVAVWVGGAVDWAVKLAMGWAVEWGGEVGRWSGR